ISSGAEGVGEHARMPRTVELNAEIEGRIERLQNAGPRSDYTFQEFTWQMLRIGLNVYEKQILPVETCGDR
ncbi:MAG: hypothetical protein FWB78_08900, partial [Treponema sp.]|nr:hypothetical protein [Treponema sp.]